VLTQTWVLPDLTTLITPTQAIIRAVCAIIDAFHFEVPVAGNGLNPDEAADADGDVADGGDEGASQTKHLGPRAASYQDWVCSTAENGQGGVERSRDANIIVELAVQ